MFTPSYANEMNRNQASRRKIGDTWDRRTVWWRTVPNALHFRGVGGWVVGGRRGMATKGSDVTDAARKSGSAWNVELVEFVSNISLHCFRWLVEPTISGWEK